MTVKGHIMRRLAFTRYSRFTRVVIGLTTLAGAAALTGIALASTTRSVQSASVATPSTLWTWTNGTVPGVPITASVGVQEAASRAGVAVSSLRAAATAPDGLMLLFGHNSTGNLCAAGASSAFVSTFTCLSGWTDKFAMLYSATDGGPREGVVDHASLVGVARPDVTRISVTTRIGTSDIALNRWRGFSYTAASANDLPLSITAYNASGMALETEQIEGTPSSN